MSPIARPKQPEANGARMKGGRKPAADQGRATDAGAPRPPTMIDVAARAGVSQTTVSLVLNNALGARLSASTRARVRDAARELGYTLSRRGPAEPDRVGSTVIGFISDEISTDPWCALQLDAVREKAWEHGLTVTAGVSHSDPELEEALLAQLLRQPLVGLIYATILTRHIRPLPQLYRTPTVLLNCFVQNHSLASVVPGRAPRRLRRHPAPDSRRPPPHRPHPRPVLDRPLARPAQGLPPGAGRARHPLRPRAGASRQLGAADRLPAHHDADGPARPADRDLRRQRHDGGRHLRRAEGARPRASPRTSRWSATTTARSPSSCARR